VTQFPPLKTKQTTTFLRLTSDTSMLWARVSVMGPTDPVTAGPGAPGGPGKTGRPYPTKKYKRRHVDF
jgi:hypothetical protein